MEENLFIPYAVISSAYPYKGKIYSGSECVPVNMIPKDFPVENHVVNLYPGFTYQKILGFGSAMTESAAYVLSLLPEPLRKEAIRECFGSEGGYSLLRVPDDSCDFSLGMYQAVADSDPDLASFSLERDRRYIIPAIRDAIEASDEPISVLLAPWSPLAL